MNRHHTAAAPADPTDAANLGESTPDIQVSAVNGTVACDIRPSQARSPGRPSPGTTIAALRSFVGKLDSWAASADSLGTLHR